MKTTASMDNMIAAIPFRIPVKTKIPNVSAITILITLSTVPMFFFIVSRIGCDNKDNDNFVSFDHFVITRDS